MSRIGLLPISVPSGVDVTITEQIIKIKGSKGELSFTLHPSITVQKEDAQLVFKRSSDAKTERALHGLSRALVNNMIQGVTKGFEKRLELRGVGYRFNIAGKNITLSLGYSHPIQYKLPDGVTAKGDEENKNLLILQSIDAQLLGEVAAQIRSFRKPEPYKGKGVRYQNEYVPIKQGKAAAKAA